MRRLAHGMFTFCSGVSLVLWVAACVLWVRSGTRIEDISHGFWSKDGGLYVNVGVMQREFGLAVAVLYDASHGDYYERWMGGENPDNVKRQGNRLLKALE